MVNETSRVLDSFQNEVTVASRNESVEAVNVEEQYSNEALPLQEDGDRPGDATTHYASDGMWDTDEHMERMAGPRDRRQARRKRDLQGRWS